VVHAQAEHRHEVAVMQGRGERRLADQRALELVLADELRGEQLDRDAALEAAGAVRDREVHLGHAAATEAAHELLGTHRASPEAWRVARQCTATSSTAAPAACGASWSSSTVRIAGARAGSAKRRS